MSAPKPHINAFICERVLTEKDEVLSAIRLIDVITLRKTPRDDSDVRPESHTPAAAIHFVTLVRIKAGDATGQHVVAIQMRTPAGEVKRFPQEWPVELKEPAVGTNFIVGMNLPLTVDAGIYWIDILWDGERATSVPLTLARVLDSPAEPIH